MTVEQMARICHELNREYCRAIEDHSQQSWDRAPHWQRESARDGVKFHLDNPNATEAATHASWLDAKIEDGWVYGKVKDVANKTHPCMVPFEQLPTNQQIKDRLFSSTVKILSVAT